MSSLSQTALQGSQSVAEGRRRPRWLRLPRVARHEVVLALLLLLCYSFFRQAPAWNEWSRYDLVVAIVDDGTTRIDPYHENTGDKAFRNGHYYSDKAPGSSFLAVPAYAALRGIASLAGLQLLDDRSVLHALTFIAAGLPTVLLVLLLLRFLRSLVDERWALTLAIAYALGTIAFPFATMYFGHAAATFFIFATFYLLWRTDASRPAWGSFAAGFLAGWAVLVDFTAVIGVALLLCYGLSRGWRVPLLIVLGALPPALLLLAYNWLSFGDPFSLGYANLANEDFASAMSQGIFGVTQPKLSVLNDILLGPRGLLLLSPWLALAPVGMWAAFRPGLRREVALCGAMVLAFLLFNACYYLPFGGWTPGPRFLMPMLPFATVLVALAPRPFRLLIALQVLFSLLLLGIATGTMPNAPESIVSPLGDLWLPRLLGRDVAETTAWLRWGLHGAQPLFLLVLAVGIALLALYTSARPTPARGGFASVSIGLLVAMLVVFGMPFDFRGTAAANAQGPPVVAILDVGASRVPQADEPPHFAPWAQIENRGGQLENTKVTFEIYNASGDRIWAAWHGDVDWLAHERKRLGVEWSAEDTAPGDYRLSVVITAADGQQTFARAEHAGFIRVQR